MAKGGFIVRALWGRGVHGKKHSLVVTRRQWIKAGIGTAAAVALAVPVAVVAVEATAGAASPTTTVVTDNGPNPSIAGQSVNITVAVTGSDPTGTVSLLESTNGATGVLVGTASLVGSGSTNIATFNVTTLPVANAPGDTLDALYAGDTNNSGSFDAPGPTQVVNNAPPIVLVDNGPNPSNQGQSISLTATVNGNDPTGNVTFVATPASGGTTVTLGTQALTGSSNSNTASISTSVLTQSAPGNPWVLNATYAGDTNNPTVNTDSSTPLVLQVVNAPLLASPTLPTTPSAGITIAGIGGGSSTISDTATLTGSIQTPGGNGAIQFSLFGPSATPNCSTNLLGQWQVPTNGDGDYTTSPAYTPTAAGTYWWKAGYTGDVNNNPVSNTCTESVVVGQASPTVATTASVGGQAGLSVTDTATITNAYHLTGESVTFNLYGPSPAPSCTTSVATTTGTIGLSGMSYQAKSSPVVITTPGTYYWVASYAGDTNNTSAAGNCGDSNESVIVTPALSPTGPTLPSAPGCAVYTQAFAASVSGYTYAISSPYPPGLSFNSSTGVLSGTPSAAGYYSFRVTASGPGLPTISRSYSLQVTLCIDGGTTALPGATRGHAYSFQLTGTKGTAPYRFVMQSPGLPAGLSLSLSGLVSGTTNAAPGTYHMQVYVSDSANPQNTGVQNLTITVS